MDQLTQQPLSLKMSNKANKQKPNLKTDLILRVLVVLIFLSMTYELFSKNSCFK